MLQPGSGPHAFWQARPAGDSQGKSARELSVFPNNEYNPQRMPKPHDLHSLLILGSFPKDHNHVFGGGWRLSYATAVVIDEAKARYRKGDFPMKPSFRFRLLAFVLVVLGATISRETPLQADPSRPRVFALLIGDTADPRVGESVKKDLSRVRRTLEKVLPSGAVFLEEISGGQLSRTRIESSILNLQDRITSDDTVFCYVATRSEFTVEPLLVCSPTGDRMSRGLLRQRIELLTPKPRLIVLITDLRNSHRPVKGHWVEYQTEESNHEVGRSLFQLPRGLIDFTSDPNGQGRATVEQGGELTRAWCMAVGGSPNVSTTWDSIQQRTKRLNQRLDKDAYQKSDKTAPERRFYTDLPEGSMTQSRLGLIPRPSRQDGHFYVAVEEVMSGSPATNLFSKSGRYTLVANKHGITEFNEQKLTSIADLERAVLTAGATAKIKVFRVETPDDVRVYDVDFVGNSLSSSDKRAGTVWGLRLKPVDVSNQNPWMVVECIVPGSPADTLPTDKPLPTLAPGDRLRFNEGNDQDLKERWNDPKHLKLTVQVLGPDNEQTSITLTRP